MKSFISKTIIIFIFLNMCMPARILQGGLTPAVVIKNLKNRYASISDYQCRMDVWSKVLNKIEKRTINFYFKKPRNIRMDIIYGSRPFDTGSVGVFKGRDSVTGRKGGLLSFISVTVDKHNDMATTIRGVTFDQSDIQAAIEKLEYHLAKSKISAVYHDNNIYEIISIPASPSENDGSTKDILSIDGSTWLPVLCRRYEGDVLVQSVAWKNYILNEKLPDQLFSVWYPAGGLEKIGIRSINSVAVSTRK